jgi:hypothetical protein
MTVGGPSKFWVIPPAIYEPLEDEFHFTFDPCPYPRPNGFDGLSAEWGESNWVNPLFGGGITAWVRKAIAENAKGKTVVLILPLDNWVRLLLEARAEVRVVGSHEWIHADTGERRKSSRPSFLFILRAKKEAP